MSVKKERLKKGFGQRIGDKFKTIAARTLRGAADFIEGPRASFEATSTAVDLQIDLTHETIWATQQQIAELFERDKRTISEHLKNLFIEKELDEEAVVRKFRTTGADGKTYDLLHYNLDAILAIGYRVSSPKATRFRQWATKTLRSYIVDGYVLNEERLRKDSDALQELAEKVRALRTEEVNLYKRVRDCFKLSASDYDGSSAEARSFYAVLQDKFLYAACETTAAEIVLTRADANKPKMGMTSFDGARPTLQDAKTGKNYLSPEELRFLQIVADAFLLFAEGKAMMGKKLVMAELLSKMDRLLEFHEMPVFPGYGKDYLRPKADAHAEKQLKLFQARVDGEKFSRATRSRSVPVR